MLQWILHAQQAAFQMPVDGKYREKKDTLKEKKVWTITRTGNMCLHKR